MAELVLFAIVGLVYWLSGWQTAYQYGQGLLFGGIVAIGIGVLNLSYHWFKHLGDCVVGVIAIAVGALIQKIF